MGQSGKGKQKLFYFWPKHHEHDNKMKALCTCNSTIHPFFPPPGRVLNVLLGTYSVCTLMHITLTAQ